MLIFISHYIYFYKLLETYSHILIKRICSEQIKLKYVPIVAKIFTYFASIIFISILLKIMLAKFVKP